MRVANQLGGGEILARVVDITSKATSSLPPTPLALVSSTPPWIGASRFVPSQQTSESLSPLS